ncbi:photosynthetic NDH subunit of lumenal location 1, chloroplastic isoform X3 [Amborella trichopoda]|uniref:photosynthetic NDH subunit of lumenal location 1, chloroplastic isoform X3 n=1 Tax=Amborella trichopoda TaxID=13333 RepID=UPI0009BFCEE8|nr:photosynthetic NDH subunit of lumenal location 1, chloroplastic isoform X3 [Amborella trichopoda]|eukprot:XP_020522842.1 photosynthetic NDH subunit of lumenal location 1, chloroplastic isoform X3 [Amborella trichopoda]
MAALRTAGAFHGTLLPSSPNKLYVPNSAAMASSSRDLPLTIKGFSKETVACENGIAGTFRRQVLVGIGALATVLLPVSYAFSEEVPKDYQAYVDFSDGYSFFYPSDWRDFEFLGHDSAFKDRILPLQNVVMNLVNNVLAAPNQRARIFDIQERSIDGKNYYTFEYELASANFSRTAFATIAIANGKYYTLIVGANERRWSRVRNKLKVVADSFKVFDA